MWLWHAGQLFHVGFTGRVLACCMVLHTLSGVIYIDFDSAMERMLLH